MGFFKKLFSNNGFFYVVDLETLKNHLIEERDFSIENNLEASANLYIYINNQKHHIRVWNYSASKIKEDRVKEIVIYFDDNEYNSLDSFINERLTNLPQYFKIELIDCDSVTLNTYMEQHPELKVENYK